MKNFLDSDNFSAYVNQEYENKYYMSIFTKIRILICVTLFRFLYPIKFINHILRMKYDNRDVMERINNNFEFSQYYNYYAVLYKKQEKYGCRSFDDVVSMYKLEPYLNISSNEAYVDCVMARLILIRRIELIEKDIIRVSFRKGTFPLDFKRSSYLLERIMYTQLIKGIIDKYISLMKFINANKKLLITINDEIANKCNPFVPTVYLDKTYFYWVNQNKFFKSLFNYMKFHHEILKVTLSIKNIIYNDIDKNYKREFEKDINLIMEKLVDTMLATNDVGVRI